MAARDHFRAHARRRVDLNATLRDRQTAEEQTVRVRDLGLGGACVELPEPRSSYEPGSLSAGWSSPGPSLSALLEPETTVTIELTAPTLWDPLSLRGRIAWIRRAAGKPARAGVRFEHHDTAALFALHDLLGTLGFDVA
ncbi:MAG TPA: PilZ domain-containing protein [Candidatus Nanopelagicales bacterium]|nr:PilZ domain-containing protein [Candidatus Nanopelagicales bacterium]